MAWYHVNSCDCPIGCCDCGVPQAPAKYYVYMDTAANIFESTRCLAEARYFRKYGNQFVPEFPKGKPFYYLGEL